MKKKVVATTEAYPLSLEARISAIESKIVRLERGFGLVVWGGFGDSPFKGTS